MAACAGAGYAVRPVRVHAIARDKRMRCSMQGYFRASHVVPVSVRCTVLSCCLRQSRCFAVSYPAWFSGPVGNFLMATLNFVITSVLTLNPHLGPLMATLNAVIISMPTLNTAATSAPGLASRRSRVLPLRRCFRCVAHALGPCVCVVSSWRCIRGAGLRPGPLLGGVDLPARVRDLGCTRPPLHIRGGDTVAARL